MLYKYAYLHDCCFYLDLNYLFKEFIMIYNDSIIKSSVLYVLTGCGECTNMIAYVSLLRHSCLNLLLQNLSLADPVGLAWKHRTKRAKLGSKESHCISRGTNKCKHRTGHRKPVCLQRISAAIICWTYSSIWERRGEGLTENGGKTQNVVWSSSWRVVWKISMFLSCCTHSY